MAIPTFPTMPFVGPDSLTDFKEADFVTRCEEWSTAEALRLQAQLFATPPRLQFDCQNRPQRASFYAYAIVYHATRVPGGVTRGLMKGFCSTLIRVLIALSLARL